MTVDMLTGARNLFDGMPSVFDDDTTNRFLKNIIFEGGALAAAYDLNETQSQDDRAPFTQATNDPHDAFMQDKVGLDSFQLDHEFPEDYGLEEEEDDMDIDGEPLFEDEHANQTIAGAPKHKSKRTKAYTPAEDKLLCECWRDTGQDPKVGAEEKWCSKLWRHSRFSTTAKPSISPIVGLSSMARRISRRNMPPSWRVGKRSCGGHCDGEKARPRGKTNSKKEDKRDAASTVVLEKVERMISKKDFRKEKHRQEKEEQMHTFMEI
ncbi:DNA repair protein rhp54 [Hordeum vulgare]|nr:DNA repair protein rhp54 [Hordeum vulgare]